MSFKDRANEILEQGKAERANYSPDEGSLALRMYQYWAEKRPEKVPLRENFCHYWRVVAIWAPLAFIEDKIEPLVDNRGVQIVLGLVALAFIVYLLSMGGSTSLFVVSLMAAVAYLIYGFMVGTSWALQKVDPRAGNLGVNRLMAYSGTLPSFVSYWITVGIHKYNSNRSRVQKIKLFFDRLGWAILILLGAVAVLGLVAFALTEFTNFLIGLGIVVAFAAIFESLTFLGSYFSLRHKKALEARTTFVEEELWPGYTKTRAIVEPSRTAKFFITVGQFINLAFQVIRVKKWKICPIVEIPNG